MNDFQSFTTFRVRPSVEGADETNYLTLRVFKQKMFDTTSLTNIMEGFFNKQEKQLGHKVEGARHEKSTNHSITNLPPAIRMVSLSSLTMQCSIKHSGKAGPSIHSDWFEIEIRISVDWMQPSLDSPPVTQRRFSSINTEAAPALKSDFKNKC